MNYEVFHLGWQEQSLFLFLYEHQALFPLNFQMFLFLAVGNVFTACTNHCSVECSKGTVCRSLKFCLSASLSSVILCPANSSHLDFPKLPAVSPELRETTRIWPGFLSLCYSLVTSSSWGNPKAYHICFLSGIAILFCQAVFLNAWIFHCFVCLFVCENQTIKCMKMLCKLQSSV